MQCVGISGMGIYARFKPLLTILVCVQLSAACGDFFTTKKRPSSVSQQKRIPPAPLPPEDGSLWGRPDRWQLADPKCSAETAVPYLGTRVRVWVADQGGELRQQEFDLSDFSGVGLRNEFIAEAVMFTSEVESVRSANQGAFNNQAGSRAFSTLPFQFAQPQGLGREKLVRPLYFCQTDGGYRRNSIENAALAALLGVRQAYLSHKKLATKGGSGALVKRPLQKLRLLVHPLYYEKKVQNGKIVRSYLVDNAYWGTTNFSELSDLPFVAVLPHSQGSAAELKFYYWELPAWFAHEYGHHIFHAYTKEGFFGTERYSSQTIIDGLNEAFADLIAHYSLDDELHIFSLLRSPFSMANRNRDVRSSALSYANNEFTHRADKILSSTYVDTYLGYLARLDLDSDEVATMQDCHYLGAIVAHAFYTLLEPLESLGLAVPAPSRAPLEAVLTWARRLPSLRDIAGFDRRLFFSLAMGELVNEAHAQFWPLGANLGAVDDVEEAWWAQVKKLFPAFYDEWANH